MLDLRSAASLRRLLCADNEITSLNPTNCPLLEVIQCETNQLSALNIRWNPKLYSVYCWGNQITELGIGYNMRLVDLVKNGTRYTYSAPSFAGYSKQGRSFNVHLQVDLSTKVRTFKDDCSGVLRSGDGWRMLWRIENAMGTDGKTPHTELTICIEGENPTDGTLFTFSEVGDGYAFPWFEDEYGYEKSDFTNVVLKGTSVNPLYVIHDMFTSYDQLAYVTLDHVVSIGTQAFQGCAKLKNVNGFDATLAFVEDRAFQNCVALTNVRHERTINGEYIMTMPTGLRQIGVEAFQNTALASIDLYPSVTVIGANAFDSCGAGFFIRCNPGTEGYAYAEAQQIPTLPIDAEE